MSSLALSSRPATPVVLACWKCGISCCRTNPGYPVHCRRCAKIAADDAARALRNTVLDLVKGEGSFHPLTRDARQEILDSVTIKLAPDFNAADDDGSPDPITRAQIEQPEDYAHLDVEEFAGRPRAMFA